MDPRASPHLPRPVINRVRELRLARGWTQGDLADRLDVSRQTIYAIENARFDPSLPLALAIGELFGLPVEQIFLRG